MRGAIHQLRQARGMFHKGSKGISLWVFLTFVGAGLFSCGAWAATPRIKNNEKDHGQQPSGPGGHRCERPAAPKHLRELTLSLGMGVGGARVPSLGWFRSDAQLSVELGVAVHPRVQVRVAFTNSVERFWAMLSFGGAYLPLNRRPWGTPYLRGSLDVLMAGAGVQPGLTGAVGYAWWSPWPLGLYCEARASGRLTTPRVFEMVGSGGVFVYF
jgi:hypothetical protein